MAVEQSNTPEDTKRCEEYPNGIRHATSDVCWVDHNPCEVVGIFLRHLQENAPEDWRDALEKYSHSGVCQTCRAASHAAQTLPGTRLGHHARAIFLRAADEGKIILTKPGMPAAEGPILHAADDQLPRAEQEARLRAARSLERSGLIRRHVTNQKRNVMKRHITWRSGARGNRLYYTWGEPFEKERRFSYTAAALTPFGAELVSRYRHELETGKPIRWDHRVSEALVTCRQSPTELLTAYRSIVERVRESGLERWGHPLNRHPLNKIRRDAALDAAILDAIEKAEIHE